MDQEWHSLLFKVHAGWGCPGGSRKLLAAGPSSGAGGRVRPSGGQGWEAGRWLGVPGPRGWSAASSHRSVWILNQQPSCSLQGREPGNVWPSRSEPASSQQQDVGQEVRTPRKGRGIDNFCLEWLPQFLLRNDFSRLHFFPSARKA